MTKQSEQQLRELQAVLKKGSQKMNSTCPLSGTPFRKQLADACPGLDAALQTLAVTLLKEGSVTAERALVAALGPDVYKDIVVHELFNLNRKMYGGRWAIKGISLRYNVGHALINAHRAMIKFHPEQLETNLREALAASGANERGLKRTGLYLSKATSADALALGAAVVDPLLNVLTALFTITQSPAGYIHLLTPDVAEQLETLLVAYVREQGSLGFMITPPNEITQETLPRKYRYNLVTSENEQRAPIEAGPAVLKAANKLQATPYSVDERVLRVIEKLDDASLDALVAKATTSDLEMSSKAAVRQAARREGFRAIIESAKSILNIGPVYFPVFIDWRGRLYYNADTRSVLSPQSISYARDLLCFAEGVELGPNGLEGLYRELANAMGWDKETLATRTELSEKTLGRWADIALGPLEQENLAVWMAADNPVKALSCIMDIFSYYIAKDEGRDPTKVISRTITHIDGSCNGLQHISLLARQAETARAVNVLGSADSREDIYQRVADHVVQNSYGLMREAFKEHGRKLCKQPTMTLIYGATKIQDQIHKAAVSVGIQHPDEFAKEATPLVLQARKEVVVGMTEVVEALLTFASDCGKDDRDPTWTVPSGAVVTQRYRTLRKKKVRVGKSMTTLPDFSGCGAKFNTRKNRQAIRANFIHSMDGAHMALSVNAADFPMSAIHDSFGCHAANQGALRQVLKEQLAAMYSTDILYEVTGVKASGDLTVTADDISDHAFA